MRGFAVLLLCCVVLLGSASVVVVAYNNGAGAVPPMGWNTWCTQDACGLLDICTEQEVHSVAQAMVSQGLLALGYQYVNLDDCWSDTERDAQGNLQPNPQQFPSGMKALADYLHSLGLKLGVYTCVGQQTCKWGRPGSFGHYQDDANTLAGWGIDFVKADNCHLPGGYTEVELYSNFSSALNSTGREIFFSLCEWGNDNVTQWGGTVGQMFRVQMDHLPFWQLGTHAAGQGWGQGTLDIINYVSTINPSQFVQQYGYLDPDFLETLFPVTMNFVDSRTEFTFWSMWSAPLIIATDIRNLTSDKAKIITNPEVIAIDQDPAIIPADLMLNNTDGSQIWSRKLANGDVAFVLFNSANSATLNITAPWAALGVPDSTSLKLRDLWQRQDIGTFQGSYSASVAPHDVLLVRGTPTSTALETST